MSSWIASHCRFLAVMAITTVVVLSLAIIFTYVVTGTREDKYGVRMLSYKTREDRLSGPSEKPPAGDGVIFAPTEREWLLQCQLPGGAITQTPDSDTVIPYFGNLAARSLVDIDPSRAKDYISWYLDHLNFPDRWGLYGTIYDYKVRGNTLEPTRNYDSADSYASTFLSLVAYYHKKTGDSSFIRENLDLINQVADVIVNLQDKDGLVFVKPASRTKYLMDNAENYRGITDWASTLEELGFHDKAASYRKVAEAIRDGIQRVLYDPATGKYAWSYSPLGKRLPKRGKWYPDGVSQVYLLSCGVLDPGDPRAIRIWQEFNAEFPGWELGVKNDRFPWGTIAVAAYMMNDSEKARRYLEWAMRAFVTQGRPYPWYVLESSSFITLESLLDQRGEPETPSLAGR